MRQLWETIDSALADIKHGWTEPEKAHIMAAFVCALRPSISVEIGTWAGKGLVTLGLAHKHIDFGMAIGIDPYSQEASSEGQVSEADRQWWGTTDHEWALRTCTENVLKYKVETHVTLIRSKSQDCDPPEHIGLLRIDGNHGPVVLDDIKRYCPNCDVGAILFLDDLNWSGGSPLQGAELLRNSGWRELYTLGDGLVFQKVCQQNQSTPQ
jgi:hypothetical protein